MAQIVISGWRPGIRKVDHTKTLQRVAGLGLADAHDVTQRVMQGEVVSLHLHDAGAAVDLANALHELGANAAVVH